MYRALIVDDEPLMLEGVRLMVDWQRHGFAMPQEADSGRQALALIRCKNRSGDYRSEHAGAWRRGAERALPAGISGYAVAYFSGYQDFYYA